MKPEVHLRALKSSIDEIHLASASVLVFFACSEVGPIFFHVQFENELRMNK